MKDRIIEYMNLIEGISNEIKTQSNILKETADLIKREENQETRKILAAENFGRMQYIVLLNQDLTKVTCKMSECYTIGKLAQGMDFTEEETKILDANTETTSNNFVMVKGQLKFKNEDLLSLDIILNKARGMSHLEGLEDYVDKVIEQSENNGNK